MQTIKAINNNIDKIVKSERITKVIFALLSRDILEYIYLPNQNGIVSEDISPVNRLLKALTPANQAIAILFFKNFLAWRYDDVAECFTKKNKKQYEDKLSYVELFLTDPDNNIWTWAANNVTVEAKEIDWSARLERDFKKAFESGISIDEIVNILEATLPCEEQKKAA